jgi:glycosyltransferase involved in cell wall biosynthesis
MRYTPLVSIIVNNYNYGHFLSEAIDSALAQTYTATEVIVVDDGSTDDSAEIIAGYGEQIIPVLKENGGQASAFNAGFAKSRGDVICFLDADDYLFPQTIERVLKVWEPGVAKVQYRLKMVDAVGNPMGFYPPLSAAMDNREEVLSTLLKRGTYVCPVTSGNSFSRAALGQILPVPEEGFRLSADGYLQLMVPFCGEVRSIHEALAAYRIHGNNLWAAGARKSADEQYSTMYRRKFEFLQRKHLPHKLLCQILLSRKANELGYGVSHERRFMMARYRMALLRLDPQNHLVSSDRLLGQGYEGLRATWLHTELGWSRRLLYSMWFVGVSLLPSRVAMRLIVWQFVPKSRLTAVIRMNIHERIRTAYKGLFYTKVVRKVFGKTAKGSR